MPSNISEIEKQIGLRPSAIRYYERIGILPPAQRVSGQRRCDVTVLNRLAVTQRARQTGFTLEEIKELFVRPLTSRHGLQFSLLQTNVGSPGSHTRCLRTCTGL